MAAHATIVIPCFNQAGYLHDAINSALSQSVGVSIVVVDDGSTDQTRAVCASYSQVEYIYQRNRGLAAARNAGLRHVATDYVSFLDADDRLLPRAIEVGEDRLARRPEAVLTSGEHRYIDLAGHVTAEWRRAMPDGSHYEALLRGNYIGMGATVLFRRAVVTDAGGFDSSLRACEDYDLYLRLARRYQIDAHSMLVAEYRRYPGTMSSDPFLMLESALQVLQRHQSRGQQAWPHEAWQAGLEYCVGYYGGLIAGRNRGLSPRSWFRSCRLLATLTRMQPSAAGQLWRLLWHPVAEAAA